MEMNWLKYIYFLLHHGCLNSIGCKLHSAVTLLILFIDVSWVKRIVLLT